MEEDLINSNPSFERTPDHVFRCKEHIYIIDVNKYDLWEAIILKVDGNSYTITYPDYNSESEIIINTDRFLVQTKINNKIFQKQESIRLKKDQTETEKQSQNYAGMGDPYDNDEMKYEKSIENDNDTDEADDDDDFQGESKKKRKFIKRKSSQKNFN